MLSTWHVGPPVHDRSSDDVSFVRWLNLKVHIDKSIDRSAYALKLERIATA